MNKLNRLLKIKIWGCIQHIIHDIFKTFVGLASKVSSTHLDLKCLKHVDPKNSIHNYQTEATSVGAEIMITGTTITCHIQIIQRKGLDATNDHVALLSFYTLYSEGLKQIQIVEP